VVFSELLPSAQLSNTTSCLGKPGQSLDRRSKEAWTSKETGQTLSQKPGQKPGLTLSENIDTILIRGSEQSLAKHWTGTF
jgi:hypothetical protein